MIENVADVGLQLGARAQPANGRQQTDTKVRFRMKCTLAKAGDGVKPDSCDKAGLMGCPGDGLAELYRSGFQPSGLRSR